MRALSLAIAFALAGCGPVVVQLHPMTGDTFTFGPGRSGAPEPWGPFEGSDEARFDALIARASERIEAAGVPGGAIAVVLDGELRFSAGVGTREAGRDAPVDAGTRFRSASITKMLVAATILSLVDDGLVALDAPLTRYVPTFTRGAGFDASAVTIEMLLTHTGGIPDSVFCPDGASLEDTLAMHAEDPYWAPPGRLFDYSNADYALLAMVIERVTGQRFENVVTERVLVPSGMTTASFEAEEGAPDLSSGHAGGHVVWTHPVDCEASRAAGGVIATAADYARFAAMLMAGGGDVLSAESVRAMTTGHVTMRSEPLARYGYGLIETSFAGLRTVEHGGGAYGFATRVLMIPERRFAVVVMINAPLAPDAVTRAAASAFLGITEAPDPFVPAPPTSWAAYVGTYDDPSGGLGRFEVLVDDGSLRAHFLRPPVGLPVGLEASFERDASGAVEYLVTRIGVARRIP